MTKKCCFICDRFNDCIFRLGSVSFLPLCIFVGDTHIFAKLADKSIDFFYFNSVFKILGIPYKGVKKKP